MSSQLLRYCPDLYNYQRRETRPVMVGNVQIGGGAPVVVQSMLTSDTRDAEACVKEALGLAEAGCQIVRVTAQKICSTSVMASAMPAAMSLWWLTSISSPMRRWKR